MRGRVSGFSSTEQRLGIHSRDPRVISPDDRGGEVKLSAASSRGSECRLVQVGVTSLSEVDGGSNRQISSLSTRSACRSRSDRCITA